MYVIARFRVSDYEAWKKVFDEDVNARIRHGARSHRVFRAQDDENAVTLLLEFASRGGAEGLTKREPSVARSMRHGGVEGGPHGGTRELVYVDEVDAADYTAWPDA